MKITHTIIIMFFSSFVIQYFLMPAIMVNKYSYVTNNLGKVYMSIIMGLCMVFIEVMMHDHQYNVFSLYWYTSLFIMIGIFTYLYKKQISINDKQYLEGMIEHHSMALLTSDEILKKTDNYEIAKLAKIIIQNQKDEITVMKGLLKK
jgi:Ca2+/Na+ antiporter